MFNGSLYTMMGQYSSIVPHENACDTYFDVNVTAIDCNITMSLFPLLLHAMILQMGD